MKINKKGFTLIELLTVIAILGLLVLLATPKFLGYIENANETHLKNDIKAYETQLELDRIMDGVVDEEKYLADSGWKTLKKSEIDSYIDSGSLYDKNGLVSNKSKVENDEYYVIEKKLVNSSLYDKGSFITTKDGLVYFNSENVLGKEDPEIAENYQWILEPTGYTATNEVGTGFYKYIGNEEAVEIPNTINGHKMTSYFEMFSQSTEDAAPSYTKIISNNHNVTDMSRMFFGNQATYLDVSRIDTSNAINMSFMFSESKATILDLSKFNASKVENMSGMFSGSKAKNIIEPDNLNTSNVKNMREMFSNSKATSLDLSDFDTSKVTDMSYMFFESEATILNLSSFDTSNVTDMSYMFNGAKATTGYAREKSDADRFNSIFGKPMYLVFE